jgi:adenylate cyclase
LIVAEIELEDENDILSLPKWIAGEVTDDPRYLNANLVKKPYKKW